MRTTFLTVLVFLMWVLSFSILNCMAITSGVYKLRSVYRKTFQDTYGDCFVLKTDIDKSGTPSSLYFRGHCCFNKKFTDFKVYVTATQRGLEGIFQWMHDSKFYLTAKRIGTPLKLEKVIGSLTDAQRFVVKSSGVLCKDCVTLRSALTNSYMTVSKLGDITMEGHPIQIRSWFDLHRCDPYVILACSFIDASC